MIISSVDLTVGTEKLKQKIKKKFENSKLYKILLTTFIFSSLTHLDRFFSEQLYLSVFESVQLLWVIILKTAVT